MTKAERARVAKLFASEAEFMKFMDSFLCDLRRHRRNYELVEQVMVDGHMSEAEAVRVLELSGGL